MNIKERVIEILNGIKPLQWEKVDNLLEEGGLESFELFLLISQINMVFEIQIDLTEVDTENLSCIDGIVELIEQNVQ